MNQINIRAADRIPGWMMPELLYHFAEMASRAETCAEIGCWRGRTTRVLADHCRGTVYAVDTFEGSDGIRHEIEFMQRHTGRANWLQDEFNRNLAGLDNVKVMAMSSLEAAKLVADDSLDFALIDAAHDFLSVSADIRAWWPKVKMGGVLCGHDYEFADVRCAVLAAFPDFRKVSPTLALWVVAKQ